MTDSAHGAGPHADRSPAPRGPAGAFTAAESYPAARAQLDATGATTLSPSTGAWVFLRWLVLVPAAVAVVGAVALVVTENSWALTLGLIPLLALLGGLWYWLGRIAAKEGQPLVITPAGLTVKGVGPVPWRHLMPPEVQWQRAQHDSGHERVPVMPFTAEGLAHAQQLPSGLRQLVSGRGTLVSPPPPVVRLPKSIRGFSRDEYLSLLAEARDVFTHLR